VNPSPDCITAKVTNSTSVSRLGRCLTQAATARDAVTVSTGHRLHTQRGGCPGCSLQSDHGDSPRVSSATPWNYSSGGYRLPDTQRLSYLKA